MDRVCPLLGLAGDRRVAVDGVDAAHRCHAEQPPSALERHTQAGLCLTATYDRCERYLSFVARNGTPTPGRSSLAGGLVSTRLLLAPQPAWRGIAGRARRAPSLPLVAAGVGLLAIGGGAAAAAAGLLGTPDAAGLAGPSARLTPSERAQVTVMPEPSASLTPAVTPTATAAATAASATAAPTAVPTATPLPIVAAPTVAPPRTYVVQAGDTLAAIAEQFGTTAAALQAANGIEDPNEIVIGQVLTVP